jgi:thiol-disulfide isomerase/thioredoxin
MNKGSACWVIVMLLTIFGWFSGEAQSERKKKIVVFVFLGTDCPISQDYIGIVNKLQQKYPQVRFLGVLPASNNQEKKRFEKEYQVGFELKADRRKKLVELYDVTITPEVVLMDTDSKVRYQGAIDNWYFDLGRHRPQATAFYLSDAIDDVLAMRDVRVHRTKAIGCILSRRK